MVGDPCNGALKRGFFGDSEGNLVRCKNTLAIEVDATATCGYVLWAPDYSNPGHTDALGNALANLFIWTDTSANQNPLNTSLDPYGSDYTALTDVTAESTGSYPDPFYNILSSDIVMDSRTIGACVRATYTGALINSGGQVAALENIPFAAVLGDETGNDEETNPASVNELFKYSTTSGRFSAETIEVKARPDDSSETFRSLDQGAILTNTPLFNASVKTDEAKIQQPVFFGIAWRGLPSGVATPIMLDFIKIVEWRAQPQSGLTIIRPTTYYPHSMAKPVKKYLDDTSPGWATTGFNTVKSIAMSDSGRMLGALAAGLITGNPQVGSTLYSSGSMSERISYEEV